MADNEQRCAGCGKVIDMRAEVVRVAEGTLWKDGFRERKEWGILHRSCFNRAIGSPDAILEEIQQLSGKRKKPT